MDSVGVLERANVIARQDVAAIETNFESFCALQGQLPLTHETAKSILISNHIDTFGTGPRPSVRLFNASFEDLDRATDGSFESAGSLLLELSGVQPQTAGRRAVLDGHRANGCQAAEEAFVAGLQQVAKQRFMGQRAISIYHDESGEPLLFRKEEEEDTALTLDSFELEGAVLPAGTIVTLGTDIDDAPTGKIRSMGFEMRTYDVPGEIALRPVRLSAWAYEDPTDRALFAVRGSVDKNGGDYNHFEYFKEKGALLMSTSLGHYRAASSKIIEACAA